MMNPYHALGVPTDASKPHIRGTYRAMAAIYHPDNQATGDAETFHKITLARDILLDDERRRRFDEHGEIDEGQPDNASAEAAMRFITVIKNAIQTARDKSQATVGRTPFSFDILNLAKIELAKHIAIVKDQREGYEKRKIFYQNAASRFKKEGGRDLIGTMLAEEIRVSIANAENCTREIEMTEAAQQLFEGYTFDMDAPPETPSGAPPAPWSMPPQGQMQLLSEIFGRGGDAPLPEGLGGDG